MEEKLGWLRDFAASIRQWRTCLDVISTTLTFLNQQGIFPGVVRAYQKIIAGIATCPASRQLASDMQALLGEYAKQLQPHERLRISTEVLESMFAYYKQLEQQHSKSGFTSLLLAFPTLLRETTPSEVTSIFAKVKVSDVKEWTKTHLSDTLTAQRQRMFREAKSTTKQKAKKRAKPLQQAA
jgi:hypothetical protein